MCYHPIKFIDPDNPYRKFSGKEDIVRYCQPFNIDSACAHFDIDVVRYHFQSICKDIDFSNDDWYYTIRQNWLNRKAKEINEEHNKNKKTSFWQKLFGH